ncbi:MAG: CYTH domain-containing protein [Lachnospiraceae bacterium]|nr:CYTH domain-containing protein [Lachnospiraceae bacterium]
MEIEKKYTVRELPVLDNYDRHKIEQAYINRRPTLRIRRQDDEYYFTYKGDGLMAREEYNLPLNEESYEHLKTKADGKIITKTRYLIPYGKYTIELDVFEGDLAPLIIAEVEFDTVEETESFVPPKWFYKDVTSDPQYQNSNLSKLD